MKNALLAKRFLGIDLDYLVPEWQAMFKLATLPADLWAGVTVALVALPLNLALAIAAGVEPGVGITTAIVGSVVAALLGGQRYAITGPAAAMAVVLLQIAQTHGVAAVWLVGIVAGIFQVIAGACRFGKLIAYIPMPVIVGFTNAIGTLVIFNALENFLGVPNKSIAHAGAQAPLAGHPLIPEFIEDVISLIWHTVVHQECNIYAVAIGLLVIGIALFTPKITKAIPAQLIAIVAASLAASWWGLNIPKIIDISPIPRTFPFPQLPNLPWQDFDTLFASAVTVFLLGSIESLLSASVADGMTMSKKHHSDQELIGQGLANIVTPFFGGIPVTGVIARTAVNIRAGARTRLSSIVHALILMALSFLFAGQAEQIPLSALSGVLILTGARLIEWDATKQIWKASRTEGLVVLATTAISVLADLTSGVMMGLVITCGLFIKQISAIRIVQQEYDPDRRSQVRQPVPSCKFIRTFLVNGPLFFGAAERFAETVLQTQNLKVVILHMKSVDLMDLTGAETLLSMNAQLRRNGISLLLAELPHQPLELLRHNGTLEKIGVENIFDSFREAILTANQRLFETDCHDCAALLTPKQDRTSHAPKDCQLRNAIILNTDRIANVMSERLKIADKKNPTDLQPTNVFTDERLISIESDNDIPAHLQGTPIESLLKAQNMFEAEEETEDTANLIIGMCMDYRKQLHLPKNCAYIIRSPGANMKDHEFSVALALSTGIRYMALLVHNKCIMSDPFKQRRNFLKVLVRNHHWKREQAEMMFSSSVTQGYIGEPVSFALQESHRLKTLFADLTVVPLLYDVDSDKIFLIRDHALLS